MSFLKFIQQNWSEIVALTSEHIFLVFISTAFAVLVGVPLGILLTRKKSLRAPILGFANIMQTVPSLALFGLLIPFPFIGGIGARTAIIALSLYALLPVIRNTVIGILGVDTKVKESAAAMGMTDRQILTMVELPLAMPVILTGIRVAVVISVGVATIAAAVGAGGLGTYIFRGLRQNDNNLILTGALFSAILALFADFALGQAGKLFERRRANDQARHNRRKYLAVAAAAVITVTLSASLIGNVIPLFSGTKTDAIRVGSKDFTESVILAEILAQTLEKRGARVERRFELGGNLSHDALLSGEIDVYPEYTGTAFTAILKHQPITDPRQVYDRTVREYGEQFGLAISAPLGFANDFAILIRGETARKNSLRTISDAVPLARNWQPGFGQDFMSRADGYEGFRKAYGFDFAKQPREMDLALTYRALSAGQLDIIAGNSTDGLIDTLDLFQLADDKRYFPPYEAVFVSRKNALEESEILSRTLDQLKDSITTSEMREMNFEVDGKNRQPAEVARDWIAAKGL